MLKFRRWRHAQRHTDRKSTFHCASHWENFAINLSTWMIISSMRGRTVACGWSIHVTNWWRASGYGGLGPAGHFICALTTASCRLPPDSPSAYSNGDTPPYLQIFRHKRRENGFIKAAIALKCSFYLVTCSILRNNMTV